MFSKMAVFGGLTTRSLLRKNPTSCVFPSVMITDRIEQVWRGNVLQKRLKLEAKIFHVFRVCKIP